MAEQHSDFLTTKRGIDLFSKQGESETLFFESS